MFTIEEAKVKYERYLAEKAEVHQMNFLQLQSENRKDEAIFEKIRETTIKSMITTFFETSYQASQIYYNDKSNKQYGQQSEAWIKWEQEIGQIDSFEERVYKLYLLFWVKNAKNDSLNNLRKYKKFGDTIKYTKEKIKLDIINETSKIFRSLFKELKGYNESWETNKPYMKVVKKN